VKAAEEKLKSMQMRQKELENEILTKEEQVKKYLTQQNQVKTNQEYSALTHEIQNANADKSVIEDEVLKLMDDVEIHKAQVQEEKKNLAAEEEKVKKEVAELEAKAQSLKKEEETLHGERKNFTPSIDPELLGRYELIVKKRDGVAMAALRGESCGECGVSLPPQVVNLIKIGDDIMYCESCSRILYED
jgi:hypothetical protein